MNIFNNSIKSNYNEVDNYKICDINNFYNNNYNYKYPIISIGIILFRFNNKKNEYEYLTIKRKDTYGYVDLICGKYDIHTIHSIINIFDELTISEKERLLTYDFDYLWHNLWYIKNVDNNNSKYKHIINDKNKELCKKKFNSLVNGVYISNKKNEYEKKDLNFFIHNSKYDWVDQEWGFPKGKKEYNENDLVTACREFSEETGIDISNIEIMTNILPVEEIYMGSNFKSYKHKYFIAKLNNYDVDINNYQLNEVSDMQWKNYNECMNCFRDYHLEKKQIIFNVENYLKELKIK